MKHQRWVWTLWKYHTAGLIVVLGVTCVTILVGTYLLQRFSIRDSHKSWSENPKKEARETDVGGKIVQTFGEADEDRYLSDALRMRRTPPPVVFLKTHKTGSSTVQNLLFRMGERHGATFAFPHHTYQFSYPDKFKAEFVDELPDGSSQFDILCSHMRLNMVELKTLMPPKTIYISIVRDPVRTFESVFSYYTFAVPAFSLAEKAAEASEHQSAFSAFVESPELFWDPSEPGNCLGKNPMSFDFGIANESSSSWSRDLAALGEAFHLVMIAEHFDQSLVLLGSLLQLELEELAYVHLNTRSVHSLTPTDELTKTRVQTWNSLDVRLYDFFLHLFHKEVEKYGIKRMERDVELLRASTNRIREKCVAKTNVHPKDLEELLRPWQTDSATIVGYSVQANLTKEDQGFCMRLVLPELQYHAHLYFKQYGRAMTPAVTEKTRSDHYQVPEVRSSH